MVKHYCGTVEALPCPCCGSADLYIGTQSAQSYGIQCRGCHLCLDKYTTSRWPRGVSDRTKNADDNWVALAAWHVDQALLASYSEAEAVEAGFCSVEEAADADEGN